MFGAPILAIGTANMPRKATLLGMTLMFILGNILCALAPNYATLMAARVITALCHGAFFGIGSVVAASLVAPNKRAQAIAMMFTGLGEWFDGADGCFLHLPATSRCGCGQCVRLNNCIARNIAFAGKPRSYNLLARRDIRERHGPVGARLAREEDDAVQRPKNQSTRHPRTPDA